MNTDQRRALKKLKEMYPIALHKTLESEYINFVIQEGSKYNNPNDLVHSYIQWLRKSTKD